MLMSHSVAKPDLNTSLSDNPSIAPGMHSLMATTATTTLLSTALPGQQTFLSAQDTFLYIMLPGAVILLIITFLGFSLLLIVLIRHKKQATLDIYGEGKDAASPKQFWKRSCMA